MGPNVSLKSPSKKRPDFCQKIILEGRNDIYNFFNLDIEKIGTANIVISAPATSIVLINLYYTSVNEIGYTDVLVSEYIDGIQLEGGIVANRILWNVPFDYKLHVPKRFTPFNFYGTWLGRRGYVRIEVGLHITN